MGGHRGRPSLSATGNPKVIHLPFPWVVFLHSAVTDQYSLLHCRYNSRSVCSHPPIYPSIYPSVPLSSSSPGRIWVSCPDAHSSVSHWGFFFFFITLVTALVFLPPPCYLIRRGGRGSQKSTLREQTANLEFVFPVGHWLRSPPLPWQRLRDCHGLFFRAALLPTSGPWKKAGESAVPGPGGGGDRPGGWSGIGSTELGSAPGLCARSSIASPNSPSQAHCWCCSPSRSARLLFVL